MKPSSENSLQRATLEGPKGFKMLPLGLKVEAQGEMLRRRNFERNNQFFEGLLENIVNVLDDRKISISIPLNGT